MATSAGEIHLRFRVYLEPVDEDGEPLRPGADMVRGDVVDLVLHLGTQKPYTGIRDPGMARGGVVSNRQADATYGDAARERIIPADEIERATRIPRVPPRDEHGFFEATDAEGLEHRETGRPVRDSPQA